MTPARPDRAGHERWTDGMKNTFSIGTVAAIVAVCVSIAIGIYTSTAGLRSDMQEIRSRLEAQDKYDALKATLETERTQALQRSIETLDKRQQLQALELQNLKEEIIRSGGLTTRKER